MSPKLPHVIIIDDEERIRDLLRFFFDDFDEFSVSTAHSGEQALTQLATHPADLAVVDMRLPGMSGKEFIQAAARDGLCRRFVVHTGSRELVLTEDMARLGMTGADIFFKPAGADRILDRIRQLLSLGDR